MQLQKISKILMKKPMQLQKISKILMKKRGQPTYERTHAIYEIG